MNIMTEIDLEGDAGFDVNMNRREFDIMFQALDYMFSSTLTERNARITLAKMIEQIERCDEYEPEC